MQQTDVSIVCFHVPITLFDFGSGVRAAFATLWLKTMGYEVEIIVSEEFLNFHETEKSINEEFKNFKNCFNYDVPVYDFRNSRDAENSSISGSIWANLTSFLTENDAPLNLGAICFTNSISDLFEITRNLRCKGNK